MSVKPSASPSMVNDQPIHLLTARPTFKKESFLNPFIADKRRAKKIWNFKEPRLLSNNPKNKFNHDTSLHEYLIRSAVQRSFCVVSLPLTKRGQTGINQRPRNSRNGGRHQLKEGEDCPIGLKGDSYQFRGFIGSDLHCHHCQISRIRNNITWF